MVTALLAAGVIAGPAVAPAAAVDSIRDQQWYLDAMKAPDMWKTTKGRGVTVAVIDAGFKTDHPDLVGQLLPVKDFSGLPSDAGSTTTNHGTKMAAVIAGSGKGMGGKGAYGLAPEAKILPVKIKNNGNSGTTVPTSEFLGQISQAIVYASDQGAKVISISQGEPVASASAADETTLKNAVAHANAKGALVVASVGNSADKGNLAEYPGALGPVLGVGAVDRDANVASFSQVGPQVDLVAPGADIYGACASESGYCKGNGTSDSTALVSASAALVWSVHPDWTANQVARVLINTAGKPADGSTRNELIGFGAVRPRIALTEPGDPGPADVNPLVAAAASGAPSAPAPGGSTAPGAKPTAAPSASASAAPVPGGQQPTSAPVAQPKADEEAGSSLPIVAGVAGAVVVVAVVVFLVLRRRSAAGRAAATDGPSAPPAVPVPAGYPAGGSGQGLTAQPSRPAQAPHPSQPPQPPQFGAPMPPQGGPAAPPAPPSYGPPSPPPGDNPYAR
ncbi:S8 family serine peptidase [Kitasatospora sp. NPDC054939]